MYTLHLGEFFNERFSIMSTITKPNTFSSNTTASSSEVNANFDTIFNDYNGNITNANVSSSAAIAASKLNLATIAQAMTMSGAIFITGKGADVASTAAMTLGSDGNVFDITGTTTITSITAKTAGTIVVLQFDGIATVTDGSNLKLAGSFTSAAESTLTLFSDGTNWYEISRSPAYTSSVSNALTGSTVQKVYTETTANTTGTTALPVDNTTPLITEGVQVLSRAITPNSATNLILAKVTLLVGTAGSGLVGATLWQDSSLIESKAVEFSGAGSVTTIYFERYIVAGGTSAQTWTVRCGHTSGTQIILNGTNGSGLFNGSSRSTIILEEVKV